MVVGGSMIESTNKAKYLKIIDSVDLKELEKFGFVYQPEQKNQWEHYAYVAKTEDEVYPTLRCFVYCDDRRIGTNTNKIDVLFDLIMAGLVEKVEE